MRYLPIKGRLVFCYVAVHKGYITSSKYYTINRNLMNKTLKYVKSNMKQSFFSAIEKET